ncbi:Protein C41G11.1 a, partial [Aphelenchoides avenae]
AQQAQLCCYDIVGVAVADPRLLPVALRRPGGCEESHFGPILISLHNHNGNVARRLKITLEQWMSNKENKQVLRCVMVLYAHWHENHSVVVLCVGGVSVPYIFVGSVPNSRYTAMKFGGNSVEMFLLHA